MELNRVSVFLRGGLGNQLFQYSMGYFIAKNFNRALVLREDLLPDTADSINGISRWPNQINTFAHIGKVTFRGHQPPQSTNWFGKLMAVERMLGDAFPNFLTGLGIMAGERSDVDPNLKNMAITKRINSYANSMKVVEQVIDDLRIQVNSLRNPSESYESLVKELKLNPIVIVHLRLGDYLGLQHIYGSLPLSYFQDSLDMVRINRARIWLMTQNSNEIPEFLLQALEPERIIDEKSLQLPVENLLIMSKASAIICSNSTFSWWAAMLAEENTKVIAPKFNDRLNIFENQKAKPHWQIFQVP